MPASGDRNARGILGGTVTAPAIAPRADAGHAGWVLRRMVCADAVMLAWRRGYGPNDDAVHGVARCGPADAHGGAGCCAVRCFLMLMMLPGESGQLASPPASMGVAKQLTDKPQTVKIPTLGIKSTPRIQNLESIPKPLKHGKNFLTRILIPILVSIQCETLKPVI